LNKVLWVEVRSFESGDIKGSNKLLVSKYYSTRDSDLLVSRGILPDSINRFSGKASLSTKCVKFAEAPSFGESIFSYAPSSTGAEDYQVLAKEIIILNN
jgi:cellulose biosynthesis protein BcsQ